MREHDRILYYRAKELENTNYNFADCKDKRIFEHAVLYMKKKKQGKVFKDTYFIDPKTTAEDIESIIYYASIVGDINYYKRGNTEHYDRYLDGTIKNHLHMYFKDRISWERHHTLEYFSDPKNDMAGKPRYIAPGSLDISDFSFIGLSEREIQVIIYYMYSCNDNHVANVLNLSKNTVRTFRRRGLGKMRRTNNYQKLLDLSQPIMEE